MSPTGVHHGANVYVDPDGRPLVARVVSQVPVGSPAAQLAPELTKLLGLLGGLGRSVKPGDRVLLKPNFNSPDPTPASADVEFVAAAIEVLRATGITAITVGESSGLPWHPTRKVLEQTGLSTRMAEMDVPVIIFDEHDWVEVDVAAIGARYLDKVRVPAALEECDRLIFLPNLKTHRLARFTMSLKLSVGLMHPDERGPLHSTHLEEKVAELALAVRPDLILLDGRLAFVTRGPANGELVAPGVLMAGSDQVALDVEAVKVLQGFKAENRLDMDAWDLPQIKTALASGIGTSSRDYTAIRG